MNEVSFRKIKIACFLYLWFIYLIWVHLTCGSKVGSKMFRGTKETNRQEEGEDSGVNRGYTQITSYADMKSPYVIQQYFNDKKKV